MAERQTDQSRADEPLVILCRTGNYQLAAMIRQALESEGIFSTTDGENFAALWGMGASTMTEMKILVRQSDRPRAAEILKGMEEELAQDVDVIEEE